MNGTHRDNGIFIVTAGGEALERARDLAPERLSEVTPAVAGWMGLDWPRGSGGETPSARHDYTDHEDTMVAERLRALGYID